MWLKRKLKTPDEKLVAADAAQALSENPAIQEALVRMQDELSQKMLDVDMSNREEMLKIQIERELYARFYVNLQAIAQEADILKQ